MTPTVTHWRGRSLRSGAMSAAIRTFGRPLLGYWPLTPRGMRALPAVDAALRTVVRPPRGTRLRPVGLGECRALWIEAEGVGRDRVVLYLHGGGWLFCSPHTHAALAAAVSAAADAPVLSVDYRQLPAAPHATSVIDCLNAYRHLLAEGWDPGRIVFAGESAGANLVFCTAVRARDGGLPSPAGLVALSGAYDLSLSGESWRTNARRDALIHPRSRRAFVLITGTVPARDAALSPLHADLAGLPPTLLQVGSGEVLRSDSEAMARALAGAGVPCELQFWHGQVHGFQIAAGLPDSRRAVAEIGAFARRITSHGGG